MKSMQRKFGKVMSRSKNEEDVEVVLTEFKAVDEMLDNLVKDVKLWRNSWEDILRFQYDTSEAFATLYKAIEIENDEGERRHEPVQTPGKYMQKCLGLQKDYSDEKMDLAQEIELITKKVLRPAEQAKESTKMLHKTLKHRENMKLDYERYKSRAEHARKKDNRTPKDELALEHAEANLAQSKIDYQTADEQVKQTFPPVTEAVLSLLPSLVAQQVSLQTTLVGQLYTVLDAYTKKFGFPNPAPPDVEIVRTFEREFTSLRKELEGGITLIANGKVAHMTMALPPEKQSGTVSGLGIRSKVMAGKDKMPFGKPQRTNTASTQATAVQETGAEEPEEQAPIKPPRPGGAPSPMLSPTINLASKPRIGSNTSLPSTNDRLYDTTSPPPYDFKPVGRNPGITNDPPYPTSAGPTPPSHYQTPTNGLSPVPTNTSDYFANTNRRPSATSMTSASSLGSAVAAAAAKKKPPPPVPAKRMPSMQSQFVTALYDFDGQNAGDLSFKEGDRIRVVKKTDSQDDWWDGELKGRVGVFPANYVKF